MYSLSCASLKNMVESCTFPSVPFFGKKNYKGGTKITRACVFSPFFFFFHVYLRQYAFTTTKWWTEELTLAKLFRAETMSHVSQCSWHYNYLVCTSCSDCLYFRMCTDACYQCIWACLLLDWYGKLYGKTGSQVVLFFFWVTGSC